jgi:hypothetical protein
MYGWVRMLVGDLTTRVPARLQSHENACAQQWVITYEPEYWRAWEHMSMAVPWYWRANCTHSNPHEIRLDVTEQVLHACNQFERKPEIITIYVPLYRCLPEGDRQEFLLKSGCQYTLPKHNKNHTYCHRHHQHHHHHQSGKSGQQLLCLQDFKPHDPSLFSKRLPWRETCPRAECTWTSTRCSRRTTPKLHHSGTSTLYVIPF